MVWVKDDSITLGRVPHTLKKPGYELAFLWYSDDHLEGLFLVPGSKMIATQDKLETDFPDAIMIASYHDSPADEPIAYFAGKKRPPFHGLNDCTHFTSECLIKGGFAVTNEHARRGAPDLYSYLYYHASTKVLASEVTSAEAGVVIGAGLFLPGDVIVYTNRSDRQRHHGVVHVGGGKIAMHTYHQFNVDWQTAGGDDQLYSLFHLSLDDVYTPWVKARWVGWWQIGAGTDVRYCYLNDSGHVFTTKTKPSSTNQKPKGHDYWFADATKMRTCVRAKGIVEEFSMDPTASPDGTVKASGKRINDGVALQATKL